MVKVRTSGARRSVVELDEDKVEPRSVDGVCEMRIRYHTLRCPRNIVGLGDVQCIQRTETTDHGTVVCVLIVRTRRWRNHGLDIEVEPIDYGSPKRSRTCPGSLLRSEHSPEEVCEAIRRGVAVDMVSSWICPTQRDKNLLAK